MARKEKMKFTKKVKEFIIQKMCEGHDVSQICELWPKKVPFKDSIYRKSTQDLKFAEEYNQAYTILMMNRMDEAYRIARLPATVVYPEVQTWQQAEATLKRRIAVDEFMLKHMAPVFSRRFDKAAKIEVTGHVEAQLAVINYYKPPSKVEPLAVPSLKEGNNVIEGSSKLVKSDDLLPLVPPKEE